MHNALHSQIVLTHVRIKLTFKMRLKTELYMLHDRHRIVF